MEATLRQKDFREAIEKEITEWSDSGYKLQEPVRVIGLQVGFLHLHILKHPTPLFNVSNTFCLQPGLILGQEISSIFCAQTKES